MDSSRSASCSISVRMLWVDVRNWGAGACGWSVRECSAVLCRSLSNDDGRWVHQFVGGGAAVAPVDAKMPSASDPAGSVLHRRNPRVYATAAPIWASSPSCAAAARS